MDLSTHVVIPDKSSRNEQKKTKGEIQDLLLDNNIHHITVEIDLLMKTVMGKNVNFALIKLFNLI